MNTLGKRVEETRKRLGMSQAELAERAGISQTTLSDIERGRNERSRYAVNLSAALCVDPMWLVDGEDDERCQSSSLGERIKQVRTANGITQARLAEMSGVSQAAIGKLEAGLAERSRYTTAIAAALGVDAQWLDDGDKFCATESTTFESIASICLTLDQSQREQVLKFAQFVAGDHP